MTDLDAVRKSTLSTAGEIVDTEKSLLAQGIDIRDEDEWQELVSIIRRIEQRLAAKLAGEAA